MDRFFSVFGKIIVGAIVLVLILTGGYYIGTHKNDLGIAPTPLPTQTSPQEIASVTIAVQVSIPPIPTSQNTLVTSGIATPYTISVPTGWAQSHEKDDYIKLDKLTFTNKGYILTIYQAPMGGGVCLYQGDPPFQGPLQTYTNYTQLTGTTLLLRRSWNIDAQNTSQIYTVCQKGQDVYGTITTFGSISYETPKNADENMLNEMDSMVASLKKE